MKKSLLVIDNGEFANIIKEIAKTTGIYDEIYFLQIGIKYPCRASSYDYVEKEISEVYDVESAEEYLIKNKEKFTDFIPAVSNPKNRYTLMNILEKLELNIPTIVSPRAYIASSAKLGKGVVVGPMAVVDADAVVERCTYIATGAVVNNKAKVGECCYIDTNAVVKINAKLSLFSYLEVGEAFCSRQVGTREREAQTKIDHIIYMNKHDKEHYKRVPRLEQLIDMPAHYYPENELDD